MISTIRNQLKTIYDSCKTENEWIVKSRGVFNELRNQYTEIDIERVNHWVNEMYKSNPFALESIGFEQISSVKTSYVTIHMAGDYNTAIQCAREYTYRTGSCFQITPCDYIYTGGRESGITARVICYPRFPKTDEVLLLETQEFAFILAKKMCQKSFTIETSTDTMYFQSGNELHGK